MTDPAFWSLIALLALVGILLYFRVPRGVFNFLDKRSMQIEKDLNDAKCLREEAQELLASATRKHQGANRQALEIIEQAKAKSEQMISDANKAIDEVIARRLKQCDEKIAMAESSAIAEVKDDAVELAISATMKIIHDTMQGEAMEKDVRDGIAKVEVELKQNKENQND